MKYQLLDTPIGTLRLVADDTALIAVEFQGQYRLEATAAATDALLSQAAAQLAQYFAGEREGFDLPLNAGGTQFQQQVWQALAGIPYGEVRSYRDIARSIGRESAVRAVGAANGRNPLPIIVPCHRVIGSDGSLTGFAGGVAAKRTLLAQEGVVLD